jgi:hypothetical protein
LGEADNSKKWLYKIQQKQPDFIPPDQVDRIVDSF